MWKSEEGCCGIDKFDNQEFSGECKAIGVEMSSTVDKNKEIFMVKEMKAESLREGKNEAIVCTIWSQFNL